MGTDFITRKGIQILSGLGKAAVARVVDMPGFPQGTWLNSRVVLYPKKEVIAFLSSGTLVAQPTRTRLPKVRTSGASRFNIEIVKV